MTERRSQFDPKDVESVFEFARTLEGRTLAEAIQSVSERRSSDGHKGEFGNLVEELLFDVQPNSRDEPDLAGCGVEIKTSPLVDRKSKRRVPKERLVLGMIDYMKIIDERFESSKFLSKNQRLLIMFYLWRKNVSPYNLEFIRALLHELERLPQDREIIRRDWELIRSKIEHGFAHELSEGDTLYLGACTKSSDSTRTTPQPNNKNAPAKPRAFSYKTSYLRVLLDRPRNVESLAFDAGEIGLEPYVLSLLKKFEGVGEKELLGTLGKGIDPEAKSRFKVLVNRMLLVGDSARIEQFEKAGIQIKTIRCQQSGKIKEAMSFRNIKFDEILSTSEWEDSELYEDMSRKFLFCVFGENVGGEGYGFRGAFFWNMPVADLDEVERVWNETRKRLRERQYDSLPGSLESHVAHVRTKGRDSHDLAELPNGDQITKRCFWLNTPYVLNLVNENLPKASRR